MSAGQRSDCQGAMDCAGGEEAEPLAAGPGVLDGDSGPDVPGAAGPD